MDINDSWFIDKWIVIVDYSNCVDKKYLKCLYIAHKHQQKIGSS